MDIGFNMKRIRTIYRKKIGKKFLIFLGIISFIYFILFTSLGNRLLSPILESSLSSQLSTPIKIQEFTLRPNRFHLIAQDNYGNTFSTQGGFSLLTLRLYAHYRIECFHEQGINPINIPFKTNGALSGGISAFNIQGNVTVFGGNILYKIELHRFHLATLELTMDQLAYAPILHRLDYPANTDTFLSGTVELKGFDRRDVMGTIHLTTQTERFIPMPIKKDDNSSFDLKSLFTDQFGHIKPFDVNITLEATLTHAGVLEQFVGIPLAGALNAKGTLEGDETLLRLRASSDVAQSDTTFTLLIPDLEPSSVILDLQHGDAQKTFELFALPAPITGKISAYTELNSTEGKMQIAILNGSTLPKVLKQHYHITQPLIHFNANVNADLSKKGVHYSAAFKSNLTRMEIDNTTTHDQMLQDLLKTLR
jgi:hypothetical protein